MDFTLKVYTDLLRSLQAEEYVFVPMDHYFPDRVKVGSKRFVILRHDVDLKAENALAVARIEYELGIKASYYFRAVKQSNKPEIIREIAAMGHEIGYHYEDMAICNGDTEKAIDHFREQLAYFRQYYPVTTICMHGAPRSRYDGRDLWKHYDYHDFGIIGEPYFDVDFSKVFYLTDTGRRWDGFNVSVRDTIPDYQEQWVKQGLVFHTTDDIIKAVEAGNFPERWMMTTHPQRWTDKKGEWLKELLLQSAKNVAKSVLVTASCRK